MAAVLGQGGPSQDRHEPPYLRSLALLDLDILRIKLREVEGNEEDDAKNESNHPGPLHDAPAERDLVGQSKARCKRAPQHAPADLPPLLGHLQGIYVRFDE